MEQGVFNIERCQSFIVYWDNDERGRGQQFQWKQSVHITGRLSSKQEHAEGAWCHFLL